MGDMVRRLVSRTIAQQIGPAVEVATAPHQYAMSTRAGCECIAHMLQVRTDLDDRATVLSIDGIGAFDLVCLASLCFEVCCEWREVTACCRLCANSTLLLPVTFGMTNTASSTTSLKEKVGNKETR